MCAQECEYEYGEMSEDNSCTQEEIDQAFITQYSLGYNEIVNSKSSYLLQLSGNNSTFIAAGLSNHNIIVYDIDKLKPVGCLGHDSGITGLRFNPKNENLLYSSSLDGSIKLWDLRNDKGGVCALEFTGKWSNDDGSHVRHALTAFDVCNRDRIIVAGTESDGVDSFLLFWDVRAPLKPIGGYWESQSEDITQVKFHPDQLDTLAVGSMDGLINIFDIRQSCEDDALSNSLNTQATVDRISWIKYSGHHNLSCESKVDRCLSCVTHAETLQIWETGEPLQMNDFSRSQIADALKVKSSEDSYMVDVLSDGESKEEMLILGGSFKSECLRILCLKDGELHPWACLNGSRQVVRCCWGDSKSGLLATGGESGVLSLWRREGSSVGHAASMSKETHKIRVKKKNKPNTNPY